MTAVVVSSMMPRMLLRFACRTGPSCAAVSRSRRHLTTHELNTSQLRGHQHRERGARFEDLCEQILNDEYQFRVHRYVSPGVGDDGIDLIGHWEFVQQDSEETLVIVQCKAFEERAVPVHLVREFDSAIQMRETRVNRNQSPRINILGLFATMTPLTIKAKQWFQNSSNCMGIVGLYSGCRTFELNPQAKRRYPSVQVTRQHLTRYGTYRDCLLKV